MAVHRSRLFELVWSERLVHITKGYLRKNHVASVRLLPLTNTLKSCFGEAVCEVNSFTEHIPRLRRLDRWHPDSVLQLADDTLSLSSVPKQELVMHLFLEWIKFKAL
jgi:hypothetical protein